MRLRSASSAIKFTYANLLTFFFLSAGVEDRVLCFKLAQDAAM